MAAVLAAILAACAQTTATAGPAALRDAGCAQRADTGQRADFVAAALREAPSVVRIVASGAAGWEKTEGLAQSQMQSQTGMGTPVDWALSSDRALASGFIIDSEGLVLTNAHAVDGAEAIKVILADERRLDATLLGLDRRTDVALLKVTASGLPTAPFGNSARLCAGEQVASIGAPFGFENSVSAGVVSSMPRFLPGAGGVPLIQTDVAINPGSSGGPLFNGRGEIVGMNTMIFTPNGAYSGVSFSLPIDIALQVASELRTKGHVTRAQIGAVTQPLTAELAPAFGLQRALGALVLRVQAEGSAAGAASVASAANSGLRAGDVILSIGKGPAMTYPEIQERVATAPIGADLVLAVWRNRAAVEVKVRTFEPPNNSPRAAAPEGRDTHLNDARLGLNLVEHPADPNPGMRPGGVYVRGVSGPSQVAGIRYGDMIVAVLDMPVARLADFDAALKAHAGDDTLALLILRGSAMNYVAIGRLPPGRAIGP